MASAAANRYAQALVDLLLKPGRAGQGDAELAQLRILADALDSSGDLRNVFFSPAVNVTHKRAVAEDFGREQGWPPLVRNFVLVVIEHDRLPLLREIIVATEEMRDERLGIVHARVSSAVALDDGQRRTLESELARLTGKQVRADFAVDAELIGGVLAKIGSTIYDGSVRGQLQALREQLTDRV